MAYSNDYRKRAIEYKDTGHTFVELQEAFKILPRTYYDWKQKFAEGYYDRKVKRQRKHKIDREKLRQAVFYMLRKLGITLKKILRVSREARGETRGVCRQAEEDSQRKARLRGRKRRERPPPNAKTAARPAAKISMTRSPGNDPGGQTWSPHCAKGSIARSGATSTRRTPPRSSSGSATSFFPRSPMVRDTLQS